MLSLKLFGSPCVAGNHGLVGGRAVTSHRLALLALLAGADQRSVSREKVIGLLWPDHDPERARHLLSQSLYLLRTALGRDLILNVGDGLKLNPARVTSDVQEFLRALAAEDHTRAVELYEGPFLDGFFLSGSCEFERWVDGERDRFAREFGRAAERVAERVGALEGPGAAVEWWRRLAAHDPYSGRSALRLMQALEAAGDRAAAIQHADTHQRLLREELGAEADAVILALARRLRVEGGGAPAVRESEALVPGGLTVPPRPWRRGRCRRTFGPPSAGRFPGPRAGPFSPPVCCWRPALP
jgi:DNA-binding SARP family transcriptional activator